MAESEQSRPNRVATRPPSAAATTAPDTPAAGSLTFRLATLDNVDDLVELVEGAYRGVPTEATWTTEAALLGGQRVDRQMMSDTIADPATRVVVALAEAPSTGSAPTIVACCQITEPDATGNSVLGMFAVDPRLQGSGLGRAVLAVGEREALALGATAVELHVLDVRLELLSWYRRRGYSPTAERRPFPYGDERFGEPMRDDLQFAVLRKPVSAGLSSAPDRT